MSISYYARIGLEKQKINNKNYYRIFYKIQIFNLDDIPTLLYIRKVKREFWGATLKTPVYMPVKTLIIREHVKPIQERKSDRGNAYWDAVGSWNLFDREESLNDDLIRDYNNDRLELVLKTENNPEGIVICKFTETQPEK